MREQLEKLINSILFIQDEQKEKLIAGLGYLSDVQLEEMYASFSQMEARQAGFLSYLLEQYPDLKVQTAALFENAEQIARIDEVVTKNIKKPYPKI